MARTASRTERTEARLRPDQKARIKRAASLRGVSVPGFIVQHAEEAAIRTTPQYESWTLEAQDRQFFLEALLNPPRARSTPHRGRGALSALETRAVIEHPERPERWREYRIEPRTDAHDRASFSCGIEALDNYLLRQARQDVERRIAAVFVPTIDSNIVAGYYTLSSLSIPGIELPEKLAKKLPSCNPIGVTLLGRMAVSEQLKGKRLGELLLMHALERAWLASQQVVSWAVVVDAKEGAREFYLKYHFLPLPSRPSRLLLPMLMTEKLLTA